MSLSAVELVAHAVFDVVVDGEAKLLFREAVVLRNLPADDLIDKSHSPQASFIKLVIEPIKSEKLTFLAYSIRLW